MAVPILTYGFSMNIERHRVVMCPIWHDGQTRLACVSLLRVLEMPNSGFKKIVRRRDVLSCQFLVWK